MNFTYQKTLNLQKGEFRLKQKYKNKLKLFNPELKNNEVIIYSAKTLHAESNKKIKKTRFNLEFRFKPITK